MLFSLSYHITITETLMKMIFFITEKGVKILKTTPLITDAGHVRLACLYKYPPPHLRIDIYYKSRVKIMDRLVFYPTYFQYSNPLILIVRHPGVLVRENMLTHCIAA